MSALIQTSFANETTAYWATEDQFITLSQAIANLSVGVQNWSTYPAVSTINASGFGISNCLALDLDGQILTADPSDLLLNGVPVATIPDISNVSDWSLYPQIANVDANNFAISNVSGFELDGQQISAVGNTILVNGQNQTSNWANYNATANVNMSGFAISNTPTVSISGNTQNVVLTASGTNLLVDGQPVFTGALPPSDTSNWATYAATANVNLSGSNIQNVSDLNVLDVITPTITMCSSVTPTSSVAVTANDTQLLVNGQPVFTGALPPSDTSNWATYPAVANVNMSGKAIFAGTDALTTNDLSMYGLNINLNAGGAGSCNIFLKGNVKASTNIDIANGHIVQCNVVGAGTQNIFAAATTFGDSADLGYAEVLGSARLAGFSSFYVEGGVTFDGGTLHGFKCTTAGAGIFGLARFELTPVLIYIASAGPITTASVTYNVMTALLNCRVAAGTFVTLEHGVLGGFDGIYLQNTLNQGSNTRVIMTAGGTIYNCGNMQTSNLFTPEPIQFWSNVYNPSGGAVPAPPSEGGNTITPIVYTDPTRKNTLQGNFTRWFPAYGAYTTSGGPQSYYAAATFSNTTLVGDYSSAGFSPGGVGAYTPTWFGNDSVHIGRQTISGTAGGSTMGDQAVAIGRIDGWIGNGTSNNILVGTHLNGVIGQGGDCIAIGTDSGMTGQSNYAIAIGSNAGQLYQDYDAIAIGNGAAFSAQGCNAIAIGNDAGAVTQGPDGIAIGRASGSSLQGIGAIAMGIQAGETNQGSSGIALGFWAGLSDQGVAAIAIGSNAGNISQATEAVAIGVGAGYSNQGDQCIAMGLNAGSSSQGPNAIAIGNVAGNANQGGSAVAIGNTAANVNQGSSAVAIGQLAGTTGQGSSAVAVGPLAGNGTQGVHAVAIGALAGQTAQGTNSVAIGFEAGQTNQASNSFAMGPGAGKTTQGGGCIAVGYNAGESNQGIFGVAIGNAAGQFNQGLVGIAIGQAAALSNQGSNGIAIGISTAAYSQGNNSIAIGPQAGLSNLGPSSIAIGSMATVCGASYSNTIVLNATGAALNPSQANSCYIAPMQTIASLTPGYDLMGYNAATKEVVSAGALSTLSLESVISNTQQITYDTGLLTTTIAGITNLQTVVTSGPVTIGNFVTPADLVVSGTITLTDASGATKTQVVAQPAFVYYVATNGRVGATGAITDPFSTINEALAKPAKTGPTDAPGMTIYLAVGSYTEDVVINIAPATLPAVSIIGMGDDGDDSKRVQIRGSMTINGTDATLVNTVNTVVLNNLSVFAKNAVSSAITISGRGFRTYLKNGVYTTSFVATAPLIAMSSTGPTANSVAQLVLDNCTVSMPASSTAHLLNITSGQLFEAQNCDMANRGTGLAINMTGGTFSVANQSSFITTGAVLNIVQSAAGLTSLTNCLVSGQASPAVALITLGTNANLNLTESTVQNLDTTTEVNNTSRYIYTTSATGNLIAAIRNNITNSRAAVTQITPFQAAVPAASQLLYFGNIYTNSTATLVGNLPAQGGANFNAVRQFNTDTYTQQIQVVATSASPIVLTPTARGKTFILTGVAVQAFSTAGFGAADAGFFVIAHNGNASGGGDINLTGMSGTQIIHNRTATANGGDVYLYWTGAALVGY